MGYFLGKKKTTGKLLLYKVNKALDVSYELFVLTIVHPCTLLTVSKPIYVFLKILTGHRIKTTIN